MNPLAVRYSLSVASAAPDSCCGAAESAAGWPRVGTLSCRVSPVTDSRAVFSASRSDCCSFADEQRRCGTSVRVVRLSLPAINRKSHLARVRLGAFRTSAVRPVKPRKKQLALPETHHAMRVDYQRFTGTWITSIRAFL